MDEALGSNSHYFEAAVSRCCDNLIVLVTTKKCSDSLCGIISSHVRKITHREVYCNIYSKMCILSRFIAKT